VVVLCGCAGPPRPELVNRVDEFIVFEPLVRDQIRRIVGLRAGDLVGRVATQHIQLMLGDSALDYLAAKVRCGQGGAQGGGSGEGKDDKCGRRCVLGQVGHVSSGGGGKGGDMNWIIVFDFTLC